MSADDSSMIAVDALDDDNERPIKRRRQERPRNLLIPRYISPCPQTSKNKLLAVSEKENKMRQERGEGKLCTWDVPEVSGPVPNDIAERFGSLYRRMAILEKRLAAVEGKEGTPTKAESSAQGSTSALPDLSLGDQSTSPTLHFPLSLPQPQGNCHVTPHQQPDEEAEEAAQALEDLALGRKQYLSHGLNLPQPTVGTLRGQEQSQTTDDTPPLLPTQEGAYTTIQIAAQPAKASSIFVAGERQERAALLEALPSKDVSDLLVKYYFDDLGWVYNVLHRPTFVAECRELFDYVAKGTDRIDPAWLACYYAVLAWSISAIDPRHPNPAAHYSPEEVAKLPDIWMRACRRALNASDWAGRPQARAVQAILIMISFNRLSVTEEGPTFFYTYLSIAARLCQLLGLHKLGKDPTKMPRLDPAWPAQACSLRRELAKRIFYFVLSFDLMWCSAAGISQISVNSFDTDPPLNVNDEDLGLNLLVMERGEHEISDTIFAQVHWTMARFQSMAAQLRQQLGDKLDYAAVLQLSSGLQTELARYVKLAENRESDPKRHQRAIILLPIHNRLLRLHRPFFMRGWTDTRYEPSSIACLQHAFEIANGLESMLESNLHCFWWAYSHGLGAITVLSMSLLRKQHLGLDTASARERTVILAVRRFFERSTSYHMASATVHPTSKQALLIIDRILAATEPSTNVNPHSPLSGPRTPVAAMLRSIAASVAGGGPTKVGEVEASHDDFGVTARALLSDSMLFGGGDPTLSSTNDNAFQFGGFSWSAAASPNANAALMEATTIPATGFDALASQRALYGFATDLSPGMEPGGLPDWSALLGMDTAI